MIAVVKATVNNHKIKYCYKFFVITYYIHFNYSGHIETLTTLNFNFVNLGGCALDLAVKNPRVSTGLNPRTLGSLTCKLQMRQPDRPLNYCFNQNYTYDIICLILKSHD